MSGRALSGSLVRGMIVTQMHMKIVKPSGKPELLMMLEVMASLMPSPNMRIPITARQVSKTYYGKSISISTLQEICGRDDTYRKRKGDCNTPSPLVRMTHVSVNLCCM